jgi:lipopolysaccharide biosynthesis regulator YciM
MDPENEYALEQIQKLHEEQHQWTAAYDTRQRLTSLAAIDSRPQSQSIQAFLENEIGLEAARRGDHAEAVRRFQSAIDLDPRAVPAYLNLGDLRLTQGNEAAAAEVWNTLVRVAPDRAYLAFERLEAQAARANDDGRFTGLCRRLIDENPQDWRARLALSRHLTAAGHAPEALGHPAELVERYRDLTEHAVFYLDPHVCIHCRYRSTELLWQCPHCHDWNTFVEERIAPAQRG